MCLAVTRVEGPKGQQHQATYSISSLITSNLCCSPHVHEDVLINKKIDHINLWARRVEGRSPKFLIDYPRQQSKTLTAAWANFRSGNNRRRRENDSSKWKGECSMLMRPLMADNPALGKHWLRIIDAWPAARRHGQRNNKWLRRGDDDAARQLTFHPFILNRNSFSLLLSAGKCAPLWALPTWQHNGIYISWCFLKRRAERGLRGAKIHNTVSPSFVSASLFYSR